MYLHPHFRYYMREARVAAYAQFLESYKSVTLASMAATFGLSPGFLDGELVRRRRRWLVPACARAAWPGRRHALLDSLPGTQRISGLSPAK